MVLTLATNYLRKVRAFHRDGPIVFAWFVPAVTGIRLLRSLLLRESVTQQRGKRISGKLGR
jgi:hypothetical protein